MVEDKGAFQEIARESGLAVPALYGRFDNGAGRDADGAVLSGQRDWERFFAELPIGAAAKELVTSAALTFLPLRTIGWDVALTPMGPVLIEGNAWWGPFHNAHGLMGRYLKYNRDGPVVIVATSIKAGAVPEHQQSGQGSTRQRPMRATWPMCEGVAQEADLVTRPYQRS